MRWNLFPEKQYGMSDRLAWIPLKVIFTILLQVVACVAVGPRTRQNHLYSPSIYRKFGASATQQTSRCETFDRQKLLAIL